MPKTTEKKQEVVDVEKQELAGSPKWEIAAADIDIPRFNIRQKSSEYDAGDFEYAFGMEYDGKVYVDSLNYRSSDKLAENIVEAIQYIFKITDNSYLNISVIC